MKVQKDKLDHALRKLLIARPLPLGGIPKKRSVKRRRPKPTR
jgi:hypothetical protein